MSVTLNYIWQVSTFGIGLKKMSKPIENALQIKQLN